MLPYRTASCRSAPLRSPWCLLIRTGKDRFTGGRSASVKAISLHPACRLIKGDDTQGCFRFFLDRQFRCSILGPFHTYKSALCNDLLELLVAVGVVRVLLAELKRTLEQCSLYL